MFLDKTLSRPEILLRPKFIKQENFGLKKMLALKKNLCLNKFGSKQVLSKTFWSTKIMTPKKLGQKSFVKMGPVTAEILQIWTNTTKAYVVWTNVTITVGIFKTWSQDPTLKVWSKSDQ